MEVSFALVTDSLTGQPAKDRISFTDEQGVTWTVPLGTGHRFETEFDAFLEAGGIVDHA
jgi:hypothetical protein